MDLLLPAAAAAADATVELIFSPLSFNNIGVLKMWQRIVTHILNFFHYAKRWWWVYFSEWFGLRRRVLPDNVSGRRARIDQVKRGGCASLGIANGRRIANERAHTRILNSRVVRLQDEMWHSSANSATSLAFATCSLTLSSCDAILFVRLVVGVQVDVLIPLFVYPVAHFFDRFHLSAASLTLLCYLFFSCRLYIKKKQYKPRIWRVTKKSNWNNYTTEAKV